MTSNLKHLCVGKASFVPAGGCKPEYFSKGRLLMHTKTKKHRFMKKMLRQTMSRIFLMFLAVSIALPASAQEEEDCKLIIDFGAEHNWDPWNVYSWSSDESEVVDNPAGDFPASKVRRWQKGGGWTGFGAEQLEYIQLMDYDSIGMWMYSEKDSMFHSRLLIKQVEGEEILLETAFEYRYEIMVPKETWTFIEYPIEDLVALVEIDSFNNFLVQPDGDNETNRWIANHYLYGGVYLERNNACPETDATYINREAYTEDLFSVRNHTIELKDDQISGLQVYSMLGQLLMNTNAPSSEISLDHLQSGIYVVKARSTDHRVQSVRVCIRK
jgi:hypothetical protein